jgi:nucleotide-binding universal stress UspA family protein
MIKPLFQRIVVAYNGSQSSLHTVLYAILMAKVYKCQVKVVSVVDIDSIKYLTLQKFMVSEEGDSIQQNLEEDCEKNLKYVTDLAKSKGIKIETEIRRGAVWAEIIRVADDFKADLILLGGAKNLKNLSTLERNIISSQDGEIMGSAHCSVMVVREPFIEQKFKLI